MQFFSFSQKIKTILKIITQTQILSLFNYLLIIPKNKLSKTVNLKIKSINFSRKFSEKTTYCTILERTTLK